MVGKCADNRDLPCPALAIAFSGQVQIEFLGPSSDCSAGQTTWVSMFFGVSMCLFGGIPHFLDNPNLGSIPFISNYP